MHMWACNQCVRSVRVHVCTCTCVSVLLAASPRLKTLFSWSAAWKKKYKFKHSLLACQTRGLPPPPHHTHTHTHAHTHTHTHTHLFGLISIEASVHGLWCPSSHCSFSPVIPQTRLTSSLSVHASTPSICEDRRRGSGVFSEWGLPWQRAEGTWECGDWRLSISVSFLYFFSSVSAFLVHFLLLRVVAVVHGDDTYECTCTHALTCTQTLMQNTPWPRKAATTQLC